MTTVAGLLVEAHEITPQYFCVDPWRLMHARQTYVVLCTLCLIASILCVIFCLLNFNFLNSIPEDVAGELVEETYAHIGETMLLVVESYLLFSAAIAVWMAFTYGLVHFIITAIILLWNGARALNMWWELMRYDAKISDDDGADDDSVQEEGTSAAEMVIPVNVAGQVKRRSSLCSDDSADSNCKMCRLLQDFLAQHAQYQRAAGNVGSKATPSSDGPKKCSKRKSSRLTLTKPGRSTVFPKGASTSSM